MSSALPASRGPRRELFARYRAVLGAAWSARDRLAGPRRLSEEAAFLPAALSLQETPVHPSPRRAAYVICALFLSAIIWAVLGRIDIVTVAPGRIVVSDHTKTVQPLDSGVIRRVWVKNGDRVTAGQLLIELDATNAQADSASLQEQLDVATSEERRTGALIRALESHRAPLLPLSPPADRADDTARLHTEWADIVARLARFAAEQSRRQAESETAGAQIEKFTAILPMVRQREADFRSLTDQGFMSGHAGQDRTRDRVELEAELAMARARLIEAQAALRETEKSRGAFVAETRRALEERHSVAASKRDQLAQEHRKAERRATLTRLVAPVDGTVQQLAVHTDGGVVTPAQVLMVVVPADAPVRAEVVIDNKDIGFVQVGQDVQVKFETFPYTRYGTVPATVTDIVADAVEDPKRGPIFPAVLVLHQTSIMTARGGVALSPGMSVTAEIRTGSRPAWRYFMEPVEERIRESLRER